MKTSKEEKIVNFGTKCVSNLSTYGKTIRAAFSDSLQLRYTVD